MNDLIEREEVIKSVRDCKAWYFCDLIEVLSAIKAIPSARPKGKWIYQFRDSENEEYRCSVCGFPQGFKPNFCPNCGSDNREREDE